MIISVRYNDENQLTIMVVYDDRPELSMNWPSGTSDDYEVQEWLDAGGVIDPYDEFYGQPKEEVMVQALSLNTAAAEEEVYVAESNPRQGVNLDKRGTDKENKRRNNRAKAKDKISDQDDVLADHLDSVMDTLDLIDDKVENMTLEELKAYTGPTVAWPVWTPPV